MHTQTSSYDIAVMESLTGLYSAQSFWTLSIPLL